VTSGQPVSAAPNVTVGIPTRNRSGWLRQAIESVLGQTYGAFRVVISDNASTDTTAAVVASFDDARIAYHRAETDLGMFGNLNRVVELATTDYLVVLPDDDLLYADYLAAVVELLDASPNVDVAHSAFDLIDEQGRTIERGRNLLPGAGDVVLESGSQLIERGLTRSGLVCWTSACFRTAALREAGGIRERDEPYADAPLMMRIGVHGDFACFTRPLVAVRIHAAAESAAAGSFTGEGYDPRDDTPGVLYRQRLDFLDEARLAPARDRRYRALARRTYRRDTVGRITLDLEQGRSSRGTALRRLRALARDDVQTLFTRASIKLLVTLVVPRRR
jgi:glycosyltransferase involved in cell wall biosynthesis